MHKPLRWSLTLLTLLSGSLGAAAWVRGQSSAPSPSRRASVHGLLHAEPFHLARPYTHTWRSDGGPVDAGWILVLEVDPAQVQPSEMAEPVLYVGDQTAERVNHGDESGRVVAIVPGLIDPSQARAWFGPPELPERIGAVQIALEHKAAVRERAPLLEAAPATRKDAYGRGLTEFADRTELERRAAELVLEHSPQESELAEGLLAPLVR